MKIKLINLCLVSILGGALFYLLYPVFMGHETTNYFASAIGISFLGAFLTYVFYSVIFGKQINAHSENIIRGLFCLVFVTAIWSIIQIAVFGFEFGFKLNKNAFILCSLGAANFFTPYFEYFLSKIFPANLQHK